MAAVADSVAKPPSAYWLWLGDNRAKITALVGSGKGSDVAKKGGEMWKALSAADRAPYEKRASERKEAYEKFIATDAGQKALAEKKASAADAKAERTAKEEEREKVKAEKEERQRERACKSAVKAVEKDEKLKKPQTAYWLWLGDNRAEIQGLVGSNVAAVGKKGGEMWKALSAGKKAPYEKKAKEQKDAYDKYITSEEGAAVLKAFKDARQAAKEEFAPPPAAGTDEADEAEEDAPSRKRKANAPEQKVEPKKARGRPAKMAAMGA